jgi:23S rRNA (cytosine1962-C5)-methyltransferase
MPASVTNQLEGALEARKTLLESKPGGAFRLFNGFYEGEPALAVDLYGRSLVLHNYADPPQAAQQLAEEALTFYRQRIPWLVCGVLKPHNASTAAERRGTLIFGDQPDRQIEEQEVKYAIDLFLNQDTSLYLDTRLLRAWAMENLSGKSVLNAFAFTGSLGIAALAGGARRVVQLDRSRRFLSLAQASCSLNGFPADKNKLLADDFWTQTSRMRRERQLFDCVIVDPPYFSQSSKGTVNMALDSQRVINKVRPLVGQDGYLVAVNNALFLSGPEYYQTLEGFCRDGYLAIETLIPVAEDFTGYTQTRQAAPPVDPTPFNHSTKIAVLRVNRKDGRHAGGNL